jgi:hypothetical protein
MTDVRSFEDPRLRSELEHPHEAALAALTDPAANPLAAITWTSTHLAAVARVLHPLAQRVLPDGAHRLRPVAAADHALQEALWWLDRRLTGDARVADHEVLGLCDAVLIALDRHARLEHALVAELVQHLSGPEQEDLAGQLAAAVRRGPTRPHPNTPVHGPVAALAFGLDAAVDHVRDLLDNRSWPTPHDEPHARDLSRWGAYLTAAPYPREAAAAPQPREPDDS